MARQSEITRKLEKSVILDDEGTVIEDKGALPRSEIPQGEHPLSLGKTSIWNQFFQVQYLFFLFFSIFYRNVYMEFLLDHN